MLEKPFPVWDDRYKINDEKIDAQHKELFRLASKIEGTIYNFVKRDELKALLTDLFYYMRDHFKDEESYMEKINYPYLNAHRQMHKIIINDMSFLIQNIKTTNDLKEKLYILISDWLTKHILYHDMMVSKWLKETQNKGASGKNTEDSTVKEMIFIYSCPCYMVHKLHYEDHISLLENKEAIQCKKCKKPLVFVKTEEYTQKSGHVSKVG